MIKLTIQSHSDGKFRFFVNAKDTSEIFQRRYRKTNLIIDDKTIINSKTTCGPPNDKDFLKDRNYKKGYDIYDKKINEWIKLNHFQGYEKGKPTKLEFRLIESNGTIVLKYTGNTPNKNSKYND